MPEARKLEPGKGKIMFSRINTNRENLEQKKEEEENKYKHVAIKRNIWNRRQSKGIFWL